MGQRISYQKNIFILQKRNEKNEYGKISIIKFRIRNIGSCNKYIWIRNKVVCHNIPIRPGRNLAIIVESAAVNHRQKQMGYNAAQELYKRVQENLAKNRQY